MNSYKIIDGILHIYKDCIVHNLVNKMLMCEKWQHRKNNKFVNAILHFQNPNSGKWEEKNLEDEPFSLTSFRIHCIPSSISECLCCKYSDCINSGVQRVTPSENKILKEYFPKDEIILTVDEKVKKLKGI